MAPTLRATFPDVLAHDGHPGSLGTTLKLVALGLADGANEDGTGAHPGVRTLALFAQCHTATVVRALAALVELGAISLEREAHASRPASYAVNVGWMYAHTPEPHRPRHPRAHGARAETNDPHARGSAHQMRAPRADLVRAIPFFPFLRPPTKPLCTRPTPPPWVIRGISHSAWLDEQRGPL